MDQLNFKNMLLAYHAVHDEVLCESMDELGFFDDGDVCLDEGFKRFPYRKVRKKIHKLNSKPEPSSKDVKRSWKMLRIHDSMKGKLHYHPLERIYSPEISRGIEYENRKRGRLLGYMDSAKRGGVQREDYDLYDLALDYLLDEGYANTIESAEVILENMSEGWIENIMEVIGKGVIDPETGRGTRLLVRPDGSIIEPGTRVMRRSPQQKLSAKLLKLHGSLTNKDGTKNTKIEKRIKGLHKGSDRLRELSRLTNLGKIIGGPGKRLP